MAGLGAGDVPLVHGVAWTGAGDTGLGGGGYLGVSAEGTVNAVLIMLLITYFTTDRVLLSTFVLSVINNIITTPQDAIIDRENRGRILVSNNRPNHQNTRL